MVSIRPFCAHSFQSRSICFKQARYHLSRVCIIFLFPLPTFLPSFPFLSFILFYFYFYLHFHSFILRLNWCPMYYALLIVPNPLNLPSLGLAALVVLALLVVILVLFLLSPTLVSCYMLWWRRGKQLWCQRWSRRGCDGFCSCRTSYHTTSCPSLKEAHGLIPSPTSASQKSSEDYGQR